MRCWSRQSKARYLAQNGSKIMKQTAKTTRWGSRCVTSKIKLPKTSVCGGSGRLRLGRWCSTYTRTGNNSLSPNTLNSTTKIQTKPSTPAMSSSWSKTQKSSKGSVSKFLSTKQIVIMCSKKTFACVSSKNWRRHLTNFQILKYWETLLKTRRAIFTSNLSLKKYLW